MIAKTTSLKAARPQAGKSTTHQLTKMWLALGGTASHGTAWEEFIAALLDYMGCNRPEAGCFGVQPAEAEDIRTRITESITQAAVAERNGVSRQAIHQRETRSVKILRRIVREMEGEGI